MTTRIQCQLSVAIENQPGRLLAAACYFIALKEEVEVSLPAVSAAKSESKKNLGKTPHL